MHKLFVSGFPLDMSEMDLAILLSPHGDINTIKIVRDRKTRICKGYAFVEMQTLNGAAAATAALDGTPMGDRYLTIKLAEEKATTRGPKTYTKIIRSVTGKTLTHENGTRPKRPRKVA